VAAKLIGFVDPVVEGASAGAVRTMPTIQIEGSRECFDLTNIAQNCSKNRGNQVNLLILKWR
jgi:hypothetical protein